MATYGNTQQVGDLLSQWCFELIFLVLTAFHPHFLGNELLALFGQRCHGIRIIFRRDVASHYQSFRSAWDEASLQGLGMVGYGRTLQIPPVNMRKAMEIQIVDFPSLCHQKGRVTIFWKRNDPPSGNSNGLILMWKSTGSWWIFVFLSFYIWKGAFLKCWWDFGFELILFNIFPVIFPCVRWDFMCLSGFSLGTSPDRGEEGPGRWSRKWHSEFVSWCHAPSDPVMFLGFTPMNSIDVPTIWSINHRIHLVINQHG